jgi:hypothetical protein
MSEAHELIERARTREPIDYFGGCPHCGKNDGCLNYGRDHYFICRKHKVYWYAGSNLFSGWRDENETIWRENASLLETYTEVKPIHDPYWEAPVDATPNASDPDDIPF